MHVCAHIIVDGLVQGVGYRYYIHRHATTLGLAGYAANHADGRVEIEVEGDRSSIEELVKLARIGPRSAHVTRLTVEWRAFENRFSQFDIR